MIPRVPYSSIQNGLSDAEIANIKRVGAVVVVGGVPKEVHPSQMYGNVALTATLRFFRKL
jgi:hypothetical protein